jgi:2-keto-4-pentenoate hydratase
MKSAIAKRLLCVFMAVFFIAGLSWASEEDVIKSILDSRAAVKPFPNPSAKLPGLTVEKAYDMQKNLVKALVQKGDTISGFKGGLTSEAGQKRFGVNDALMGQIFKSGELGPDAVVNSKDFVRLFIETEVGYVIGQKISEPVKDLDSLKKMIKEVFPAVELPDLRFEDMSAVKGPDIIVDAVGSAKYIVGKKMPADKVDVSKVEVTLKLDGNVVNQGKASDCLGDQWKAALWLVNTAVAKGWVLEPGQILITGAMGNMIPGKPGKYEGDWGALGKLSWTVK